MFSINRSSLLDLAKLLNSVLLIMVIVLMLTNIATSVGLVWSVMHKSRTVVPPTIRQEFSVSDHAVDSFYLQQMAEYFIFLKLNVSPSTVERNYGQLLEYVSSANYHRFQPKLLEEAMVIKKQKISSSFFIKGIEVSVSGLQVRIDGELKKYVGARALKPENAVYIIQMSYPGGTLELDYIRLKEEPKS